MPSDQQKMYEYASNVAQLLSSDLPEKDATIQIENLVVSKIIPLLQNPISEHTARRSRHS
jgi:hypothetical protein